MVLTEEQKKEFLSIKNFYKLEDFSKKYKIDFWLVVLLFDEKNKYTKKGACLGFIEKLDEITNDIYTKFIQQNFIQKTFAIFETDKIQLIRYYNNAYDFDNPIETFINYEEAKKILNLLNNQQ